jgi:hypothetical protein
MSDKNDSGGLSQAQKLFLGAFILFMLAILPGIEPIIALGSGGFGVMLLFGSVIAYATQN